MKLVKEKYQDLIDDEKANMIQNSWKNHVGRKKLFQMGAIYRKKMEEQAAIMIQQQIRSRLAKLHFRHTKDEHQRKVDAAIMLQAAWRGARAKMEYGRLRKEYEFECLLKNSAIIIQSWFRRRKAKKKVSQLTKERDKKLKILQKKLEKELKLKNELDKKAEEEEVEKVRTELAAVINIQRIIRGSKERSVLQQWMKQKVQDYNQSKSVSLIAALWRGHVQRKRHSTGVHIALTNLRLERRRNSATAIQKNIRARLARSAFKFSRNEFSRQNAAAMLVQSLWRGHDSRTKSKYMLERAKIVDRLAKQLAQAARNRWLMEQEAERLLNVEKRLLRVKRSEIEHNQACLMVQAAWRGQVARKDFNEIRQKYDVRISHEKANQIQFAWRNRMGRQQLHRLKIMYDQQLKASSAKICQQHIRGKLARMHYKATKDQMSKETAMAIRIQSNWRASKERKNYARILEEKLQMLEEKSAICIQCAWRSKKARKKVNA